MTKTNIMISIDLDLKPKLQGFNVSAFCNEALWKKISGSEVKNPEKDLKTIAEEQQKLQLKAKEAEKLKEEAEKAAKETADKEKKALSDAKEKQKAMLDMKAIERYDPAFLAFLKRDLFKKKISQKTAKKRLAKRAEEIRKEHKHEKT